MAVEGDIELIGEGGRYGEIPDLWGPPGWFSPGGGSGGGGGGGGGNQNPFIPTFSGGQAPGFGGFQPPAQWGGAFPRRRIQPGGRQRMAFGASQPRGEGGGYTPGFGGGGAQGGFMGATGSIPSPSGFGGFKGAVGGMPRPGDPKGALGRLAPQAGQGDPYGQAPYGLYGFLLSQAGREGAFGLNPPEGIMAGVRGRAIADAGAQQRAARVGLQSRGDTDASTYGFQALMSQLGGQDQTARALSSADLGLRQQQLAFIQDLLKQWYAGQVNMDTARSGQNQGFDWAGVLSGLGRGVAQYGGGGGGAPPGGG